MNLLSLLKIKKKTLKKRYSIRGKKYMNDSMFQKLTEDVRLQVKRLEKLDIYTNKHVHNVPIFSFMLRTSVSNMLSLIENISLPFSTAT